MWKVTDIKTLSLVVDESNRIGVSASLPLPMCCGGLVMTVMEVLVMNGSLLHLQHLPRSSHRDNSEQGGSHCSHAMIDEIVNQPVKTMGGK